METYIIFWKKDKINQILKNGDKGPLSVLYGGPHQSQPAFGKVGVGDRVYPITVINGILYVLGRMTIESIMDAEEYLHDTLKIDNPDYMWDTYWSNHKNEVTHKIPTTCADYAALGSDGTALGFREVPADIVSQIRIGPKPGQEVPLKVQNGIVVTVGLFGYYRRLSHNSATILDTFLT